MTRNYYRIENWIRLELGQTLKSSPRREKKEKKKKEVINNEGEGERYWRQKEIVYLMLIYVPKEEAATKEAWVHKWILEF